MKRFILTILLIFIISNVSAQDYIHLCVGYDKEFGVPFTNGSVYNWQIRGDNNIASITSGNGTEIIKIDQNVPEIEKSPEKSLEPSNFRPRGQKGLEEYEEK